MTQHIRQGILCVDDHEEAWRLAKEAFRDHEVLYAPDGYTAACSVNARPFDLYVIDYWLPNWSGASFCRHIRKTDPHVPVCFVTSAGRTAHEQRARRAGASDYMQKPVDPPTLRSRGLKLMRYGEFRNVAAHERARRAAAAELEGRFALMGGSATLARIENALQRVARSAARTAFLEAGGTLAGFERSWSELWRALYGPGRVMRPLEVRQQQGEAINS